MLETNIINNHDVAREFSILNSQFSINAIYNLDALLGLKQFPDNFLDCCVTSPPYYGQRDYGTATWIGGDPSCRHIIKCDGYAPGIKQKTNRGSIRTAKVTCPTCGAIRIDKQIGLEETPELYISKLVAIFTEVHRILKPAGTLWLNIGDSYWGGKGYSGTSAGIYQYERHKAGKNINPAASNIGGKGTIRPTDRKHQTIKRKDLIGIPWMLAFALRNAGWYLRQDIIWHKPNPMPESVKDRCTKSHEYIFLLTKSENYHFDYEAILEETNYDNTQKKSSKKFNRQDTGTGLKKHSFHEKQAKSNFANGIFTRHKRDVWTVCTKAEKESHFAVFPAMLIADCIKAGCPANGIVLDPFMGSGTTAIVARKLGRNYIGFELNPDYIKIANRKINRELGLFK